MSDWVSVAPASEFPPGTHRVVDVDGAQVAVFNLDGDYFAIEDVCTHDGGILTGGPVDGDQVVCPRHGARFSIKTGEALTPPAFEPVSKLPVRVEDGIVQVRDDRWD
jgi:3-phenylpropionate/trans-cinnamate dioxygenase ferredoxin subunit